MKYRIEQRDSFQLVGITNKVTAVDTGEHPGVEQVWRTTDHETYAELKSLNDIEPYGILHVGFGEGVRAKREYDYYMAVATSAACPDRFSQLIVPAMSWVVFEVTIPWSKDKWHRIYGEWFPSSGYEQIEGPEIQVGPDIIPGAEKQLYEEKEIELWLPVKKRSSE